jgi:hypothetical protein
VKKGSLLAVLGFLVAVLAVAGCGGGDETSSLTKAEFVKQGNAVCKEKKSEREDLFQTFTKEVGSGDVTKADQEALVAEVLQPPYEATIEGLKDLGAPEGDEQQIEAITEAMEKALEKAEANPLVSLRTNIQFAEANALAVKYGLTDCTV